MIYYRLLHVVCVSMEARSLVSIYLRVIKSYVNILEKRQTMRATKLIIAEIIKTVTKLSELIEQREILRERSTEE